MKRILSVILVLTLSLALFAGCGASGGDTPAPETEQTETPEAAPEAPSETPEASLQDCTLTYYYWEEPQREVIDKTIEAFNAVHPNIKIEATVIPWDQFWTKLQTSLPTSGGPDVFQINGFHAVDYAAADLVLSLDDRIERDGVDMSRYVAGVTDLYNLNGQQYAMPKDYHSIAMFYNKEMFDKAGVPYPTGDWTWDEFRETAKKLTIPGTQYGFAVDSYMQTGIGNFIFQNGGSIFGEGNTSAAIDSPENAETFQFLYDMMYVDGSSPTAAELTETPSHMMFQAEQVAMISFGSWYITSLQEVLGDKMGVVAMPSKKTQACMLHGLGYAISANSQYPEEAWEFIKFCTEDEANNIQADVVIPALAGLEEKWVSGFTGFDATVFTDAAGYGVALPVGAKNSAMVDQVMYEALDKIWTQQATVADALAEAQAAMDAELAK